MDWKPSVWRDDERMSNLMSLFKSRDVNPDDWDAKLKFWTELLHSSSAALAQPSFTLKSLYSRFKRKDRIPAGLKTVLSQMLQSKEITTIDEFRRGPEGWVSWGLNLALKKPVSWLFGYDSQANFDSEEFVIPSLIKDQASQILERHQDCAEEDPFSRGVVEWSVLKRKVKDLCPTDQALELALIQLQRDNQVSIGEAKKGEKIAKFRTARQNGPVELTEVDTNIHKLKIALDHTEKELIRLEENSTKLESEARIQIRQGNRAKAKQILRQKQLVQKKIKDKDTQFGNMQGLMLKLAETHDQREILDAYKAGVSAFKKNLDRHGLSPENVDKTIDEIHETMEDQQEIADALSFGGRVVGSDADLEGELADLLKEEEVGPKRKEPRIAEPVVLPEIPMDYMEPEIGRSDRVAELRRRLEEA